jgi:ribosome-associated protein
MRPTMAPWVPGSAGPRGYARRWKDSVDTRWIEITPDLAISQDELNLRFARSGGPGGQNVNRTATRVELLFDVAGSPSLNEHQRALIMNRLQGYIDGEGVLHLFSQATRSQWQNRQDVMGRFRELLAGALRVRRPRRATHPSVAARERRLRKKRLRAELKRQRGPVRGEEG